MPGSVRGEGGRSGRRDGMGGGRRWMKREGRRGGGRVRVG